MRDCTLTADASSRQRVGLSYYTKYSYYTGVEHWVKNSLLKGWQNSHTESSSKYSAYAHVFSSDRTHSSLQLSQSTFSSQFASSSSSSSTSAASAAYRRPAVSCWSCVFNHCSIRIYAFAEYVDDDSVYFFFYFCDVLFHTRCHELPATRITTSHLWSRVNVAYCT